MPIAPRWSPISPNTRRHCREDSLARLDRNPMRILDSKDEADRQYRRGRADHRALSDRRRARFLRKLQDHLVRFRVPFVENPRIVRGLDYYGHTAFEFVTSKLGAQGTVMAGGRYDGLVAEMGGPMTPAVGWAAGIERLAMLMDAAPAAPAPVAVIPIGDAAEAMAIEVLQSLRTQWYSRGNGVSRQRQAADGAGQPYRRACRRHPRRRRYRQRRGAGQGLGYGRAGGRPLRSYSVAPEMSLAFKLDRIAARAEELRALLSEGVSGEAYVKASKELADIEPVVARIGDLRAAERAQSEAESLLADPEMKDLAEAELFQLKDQIPALEHEIRLALLPKDEADARSAILEIRPAAGGDEAGLFAAELFSMYQKYAESKAWRFEILEYSDTGLGAIKEATAEITGRNVFARLKYEFGGASGPAGAGDREAGAHPHLHGDRCGAARKLRKWTCRLTRATCASTSIGRQAPADSTSTRQIARCGLPTSPPASLSRCRRSAASTRTAPRR